jgi:hypothetical protein
MAKKPVVDNMINRGMGLRPKFSENVEKTLKDRDRGSVSPLGGVAKAMAKSVGKRGGK